MTTHAQGVHLAGSTLRHACHAGALFRDREQEYGVPMPFAREGWLEELPGVVVDILRMQP